MRWHKGMNRAPNSCSDVDQVGKTGSPTGREPQGDRVPIVVGGRESRPQGEGGQVARVRRGEVCVMQRCCPPDPEPLESRMLGNLPVRFGERGEETGHGPDIQAPATERVGTGYAEPKLPRLTSTLSRGVCKLQTGPN